ncbi:cadherin egf lag seven-pass g-type receptor 2 [Plakobranchus ocellatus]|uniref:Cadherin egf lag seven-pass g-type receptor 2 n=1 Tax=Plakobranchus ocellatus TaxID=259542 RepID=A0AAV4DLB2_9GAST|nr:cadherin egf lag seven-pass g-type receptor 2 [Plakobranchus ocellatus]
MMAVDAELNETEHRRVQLSEGGAGATTDPVLSCIPDAADSDQVRAYIDSVSPAAPCGKSCFSLEPCGTGGEFCLFYLPGVDTFNIPAASQYILTIGCTDDAEAPVTATMTVTIISNTPPVFVPSLPLADGQIKTQQDLRMFCEDQTRIEILATDGINEAVGPFILGLILDPYNAVPTASNLDTTVTYREKVGNDYTVLDLDTVDTTLFDSLNIHMWSNTSAGMELYQLDGTSLKTKLNPKYVREDHRSVTLYFLLDDGFCRSQTYSLTLEMENHNERPRIYTTEPFLEAYEGEINLSQDVEIRDEEQADGFTFELARSNSLFDVDTNSGNITTRPGVSIDLDANNNIYEDFTVVLRAYDDEGRRSDRANFLVRVYDKNDNQPYFTQSAFNLIATECTEPGEIVGQLSGNDDDSQYNQNNFFFFGGGGSEFVVMATGDVVMSRNCSIGEIFTGTATIEDQGIYPGPLTGDPATVTILCVPCVLTTAVSLNSTSGGESKDYTFYWLPPAMVVGITVLTLTGLLIFKLFSYCKKKGPDSIEEEPLRLRKVSDVSKISRETSMSIPNTDAPNGHLPSRRLSTDLSNGKAVSIHKGKPQLPVPPMLMKPRKSINPFKAWKNSPLTLYRKYNMKLREPPQRESTNGSISSRRLSEDQLPEVETISLGPDKKSSFGSLPAIAEHQRTDSIITLDETDKMASLARIYGSTSRKGSNMSLFSRKGSTMSLFSRKGSTFSRKDSVFSRKDSVFSRKGSIFGRKDSTSRVQKINIAPMRKGSTLSESPSLINPVWRY